jgi:hypothetical protein
MKLHEVVEHAPIPLPGKVGCLEREKKGSQKNAVADQQ